MSTSDEAKAIRSQMAQIRVDLGEEMEGIVGQARVLTDWRYYVRNYPWRCAAGAALLGYLVVPRRLGVIRPDAATLAKLARKNQLVVKQQPDIQRRGRFAGPLLGLAANMATKAAMAYMGQQAGRFFEQQALAQEEARERMKVEQP